MKKTNKRILIALLILPWIALLTLRALLAHPSDASMIKDFNRNEAIFIKLIDMVHEDSQLRSISYYYTDPSIGSKGSISRNRWNDYKKLFSKIDLGSGLRKVEGPNNAIHFHASNLGLVTGGSSKGYIFTKKVLPAVESLDDISIEIQSNVPIYRQIKKHWYLYYVWDD